MEEKKAEVTTVTQQTVAPAQVVRTTKTVRIMTMLEIRKKNTARKVLMDKHSTEQPTVPRVAKSICLIVTVTLMMLRLTIISRTKYTLFRQFVCLSVVISVCMI